MTPLASDTWYFGWGYLVWFGMIFLLLSSTGSWGYTYRTHRKFRDLTNGLDALDTLSGRYASGEISRDDFHRIKDDLIAARSALSAVSVSKEKAIFNSFPTSAPTY